MIKFDLHIFAGKFETEIEAMAYSSENFDKDGNGTCQLADDIGVIHIDHDYLETIYGEDRHEYLETMLIEPNRIHDIKEAELGDTNTHFLIFGIELNKRLKFTKCPKLVKYLGAYNGAWKD